MRCFLFLLPKFTNISVFLSTCTIFRVKPEVLLPKFSQTAILNAAHFWRVVNYLDIFPIHCKFNKKDDKPSVDCQQRPYIRKTMHSALTLSCTIRAQLISATRGRASQPKVLGMVTDCSATCQQG